MVITKKTLIVSTIFHLQMNKMHNTGWNIQNQIVHLCDILLINIQPNCYQKRIRMHEIKHEIPYRYIWRRHNDLFWLSYAPFSRQWTIYLYNLKIFFEITFFSPSLSPFSSIALIYLLINDCVPLWLCVTEQRTEEETHRRGIVNDA